MFYFQIFVPRWTPYFAEYLCRDWLYFLPIFWWIFMQKLFRFLAKKNVPRLSIFFCQISVPRLALFFCGIFVPKLFQFSVELVCQKYSVFWPIFEINNIFAHFFCRDWLDFLRIFLNQICSKCWCPDWHYFLPICCVEIGYIFCEFLCQDYCDFLTNFYPRNDPIFCRILVSKMFQFFDDFSCRNCAEITGDRQKPPSHAREQRCMN